MCSQKKHVVIITNIPAPYRVDFFQYLKEHAKDYRFTILYSSRREDNRSWKIEEKKLENSLFLESKTLKIQKRFDTKYIHIPWGVEKTLNNLSPDVVIGSEYNPTVLLALHYCRKKKIPYISWTDGTLYSERNISRLQRFLRKYVVSHADSYIASSTKSKEAQMAYGAPEEKCHISYLTVNVDAYRQEPKGTGKGKILCVGSMIQRKGVDLLLEALSKVKAEYSLYLAGEGPEKEALQKLAASLKIENRIHFLGQLDREMLLKHYEDSDLFILPTREDCFALVILEALCSKLPVICSCYADGSYDLIENEKNGSIIDPYDREAFAETIERFLTDAELRENIRGQSAKILEKFRFENVSKGYLDAITECIH